MDTATARKQQIELQANNNNLLVSDVKSGKWKSGKVCAQRQRARQLYKLSDNATDGNAKSCHKS